MNDEIAKALNEMSSNEIGTFVNNYRTALSDQYEADKAALANQRNLDYTTINSNANVRGMLHSNFPTRDKLKYDTGTYEPNLVKLNQGYQSGLDSLYSNVAKYYNQIKQYQDAIADLNAS